GRPRRIRSTVFVFHKMLEAGQFLVPIPVKEEKPLLQLGQRFWPLPVKFRGNRTVKVVPAPGRLCTPIVPRCSPTIVFTMDSPRPLPPPSRFRALSAL